jgi:hypothetical protein
VESARRKTITASVRRAQSPCATAQFRTIDCSHCSRDAQDQIATVGDSATLVHGVQIVAQVMAAVIDWKTLMISILPWNGKLSIPEALRLAHDDVSAELVRATMERGPIAHAAMRVAKLCLPHFEREERMVFPALGILPDLARGNLRPEMLDVLPMIGEFSARQQEFDDQHRSIHSAIAALQQAAQREKNREFVEVAYNLTVHERIEDEVLFPMVLLIGKYLRAKFEH